MLMTIYQVVTMSYGYHDGDARRVSVNASALLTGHICNDTIYTCTG